MLACTPTVVLCLALTLLQALQLAVPVCARPGLELIGRDELAASDQPATQPTPLLQTNSPSTPSSPPPPAETTPEPSSSSSTETQPVSSSESSSSSSAETTQPPSSTSPDPTSTVTPTTSTVTPSPTQSIDPETLRDINTIHVRRLPFIVASITDAASISSWLSALSPEGKWPDSQVNYATGCPAQRASWPARSHWLRITTMAAAFHGGIEGANRWVNDKSLRDGITRAMDYWFTNDFTNINCLDAGGQAACPCGTPGFWNTNWYANIIGVPMLVGQSCLLLNDTLTPTQLSNCTNIAGRAYDTFGRSIVGVGTLTGANTLDVASIGIDLGLLTVNMTLLNDAFARVHREVVVMNGLKADGIRADGSFGQHDGIIYNGNYGKDYANDVLALEIEAAGTQFQASPESKAAFDTLIDGDLWMIYRNTLTGVLHWDFSVLNRFISFPVADAQATGSIKINITEFQVLGQEWGSSTLTHAYNSLSKGTPDANAGSLNGNRMFYANDYIVQRGKGYVTTVKMFSTRTKNTECTNSQNPFGFHLSDGTTYTYLKGNEYEDIAAAWDWNLIPGTTVDYAATPLTCGNSQFFGAETYVGGLSDGTVGIAAMRYTNPWTKAIRWQKAWFFVAGDTQHVMINSISQKPNATAPVFSVLDQRLHVGDVLVDGVPASSGNFSNASSLWHDDVGYVFRASGHPETSLSLSLGPRKGNWTALGISTRPPPTVDLFAAWLHHKNTSASTSYTAFPATDRAAFADKAGKLQLSELQNDGGVSAVYDRARRTGFVVFWQATGGQVTLPPNAALEAPVIVQASRGLLVMLDERTWTLTVSDPAQTFSDASVTVSLGVGMKPNGWPSAGLLGSRSINVPVTLPSGGLAGGSVKIPLKQSP